MSFITIDNAIANALVDESNIITGQIEINLINYPKKMAEYIQYKRSNVQPVTPKLPIKKSLKNSILATSK